MSTQLSPIEGAPPPYSPLPSALPESCSVSRQYLSLHYSILQQEKELSSVRSLLSDSSSSLDGALKLRQTDLLTELRGLYARRKQLSTILLQTDSPLSLTQRKERLHSELAELTSLLHAARRERDAETAQVLASQIQWKTITFQVLTQKLAQTERRASMQEIFQCFRERPKTVAGVAVSGLLLWKFGLAPFRAILNLAARLVWVVGSRLITMGRPRSVLTFALLLLLSRWLGTRALFLLWLVFALKFR